MEVVSAFRKGFQIRLCIDKYIGVVPFPGTLLDSQEFS